MLSRLNKQTSNLIAAAGRIRPARQNLRLAGRSRRIAAIACLVALSGIVFGVGAAFGHPGGGRSGFRARAAHASPRAGGAHRASAARRHAHAARDHHARKHKRHRQLYMRRMMARARRAHARHHRHWARAAHHRRHKARKRRHGRHAHARRHVKHALMMRDFSPALASASAAIGRSTASLAGGAITAVMPLANSGPGALASGPAGSAVTRLNPSLTGAATGRLDALAARVRTTAAGRPTSAARPAAGATRAAGAHKGASHGSGSHPGGGFSFPLVPQPSEIEHFVNVIPESIWIALASALAFAGFGAAAAVRSGRRARRQAGEYAAVAAVALTDPLTGVLNRRGFIHAVERELARARRYEMPFVLAYVDVRGLKAVNDSEGHLAGDEVLRQVAQLLGESVRAEDSVGRLGGDELALLLTEQSAEGAEAVVERIQARVPDCREAMGIDADWDLTIGTASYPADGATFEELVSMADRRLYEQRGIQLR